MSKVVKTISWVSPKGAKIEVKIEISKSVEKDISYSDGWNVDLGNKVEEFKKISVYINGNYHEGTYNNPVVVEDGTFLPDYKAKVKAAGYYARLTGTVIISKEKYNLIMAEITSAETEVEETFKTENVEAAAKEIETKAAEIAKEIETAKEVIKKAESQNEIPTAAAEKQFRINYNNVNNEGGEGYVPSRVTLEDVTAAKATLVANGLVYVSAYPYSRTFEISKLVNNGDVEFNGKKLYLISQAVPDNDSFGDIIYTADAFDIDGNLYKVTWDGYEQDGCRECYIDKNGDPVGDWSDGSNACDWGEYTVDKL